MVSVLVIFFTFLIVGFYGYMVAKAIAHRKDQ